MKGTWIELFLFNFYGSLFGKVLNPNELGLLAPIAAVIPFLARALQRRQNGI